MMLRLLSLAYVWTVLVFVAGDKGVPSVGVNAESELKDAAPTDKAETVASKSVDADGDVTEAASGDAPAKKASVDDPEAEEEPYASNINPETGRDKDTGLPVAETEEQARCDKFCKAEVDELTKMMDYETKALEKESADFEKKAKKYQKQSKKLEKENGELTKKVSEMEKKVAAAEKAQEKAEKAQKRAEASAKEAKESASKAGKEASSASASVEKSAKAVEKVEKKKVEPEVAARAAKFEALLAKSEEDLSSCETKKQDLSSQLIEQSSSCEKKVEKCGFGVDIDESCEKCTLDLSMFTKLYTITHANVVKPYQEEVIETWDTYSTLVVSSAKDIGGEVMWEGANAWKYAKYEAGVQYNTTISPLLSEALTEGRKLYRDQQLGQYFDPVLETIESLDIAKNAALGYDFVLMTSSEVYEKIILAHVVPFGHDALAFGRALSLDLQDMRSVVAQPLQFDLFSETVEFRNGFVDVAVLVLVATVGGYSVLYQFVWKFVLMKVVFGFFLHKVLYKTIILNGVIGLVLGLISRVFSAALFVVKMAFCLGCCGLCFRRNKAAKAKAQQAAVTKAMSTAKGGASTKAMSTAKAAKMAGGGKK